MSECNGICLYGTDLGISFGGVAYAHPDCPEHGDTDYYEDPEAETCDLSDEGLRYVREKDVSLSE